MNADRRGRRRHDGRRHRAGRLPGRLRDPPARPVPGGARARLGRGRRRPREGRERGRWTAEEAHGGAWRGCPRAELEDLAGCELVIEAAPEDLELKRRAVRASCRRSAGPRRVLATNTSSLPVTALASAAARPEHVVGMHFFNPVVADGPARGGRRQRVLAARRSRSRAEAGERMGKRVIVAQDGPGFLANRCARPVRDGGAQAPGRAGRGPRRRSTGSCAWAAASGWARSSCRTWSGSTSASRSRSRSGSRASTSRAGARA